ncbi:MAG: phenol hydroxylase subunit P4 [Oceanospirillaceae bacterium]|nr:phenol hydroxylase subunit P4 [Oceanospirillaceae bacterium]
MSVRSLRPYVVDAKDTRDKFPAPLLFVGWEDHHMFCAPVCIPVPPSTPFNVLIGEIFLGVYGEHPDFVAIDWDEVVWFKSGHKFTPRFDLSLAENGLGHKDVIRFKTPGLKGIKGSGS